MPEVTEARGRRFCVGAGLGAVVALLGAHCGSTADVLTDVQTDSGVFQMEEAGMSAGALSVSIGPPGPTLCPGKCVTLTAQATGGTAPYSFTWSPGAATQGASLKVCPTATTSYSVTATDSSGRAGEGVSASKIGSAHTSVTVSPTCAADAGDSGSSPPPVDGGDNAELCDSDAGVTLPEALTPDYNDNALKFFAGGMPLPAGQYRLTYVDGCIKYDPNFGTWTVNGESDDEYVLIGATTANAIAMAPGTAVRPVPLGLGYAAFDECVAANRMPSITPPLDFTFAGGKLGMYNNDFEPPDNAPGTNGRNPTWRLDRLCP